LSRSKIAEFFDSIAHRWDQLAVHPVDRVARVLDVAGSIAGYSVLDVGSGTGVLLGPLLERVGPAGKVLALDISGRMIEIARAKRSAPNLEFAVADFLEWTSPARHDLLVAYSCYPHFIDQAAFWDAARRNLRPGGTALVAHIEGRSAINGMHASNGASEISAALGPVEDLALLAQAKGFEALAAVDDGDYYIFSAVLKP
jgi:ubiquinone/menaquinone biosynthesis C-methylase UbiE